MKSLLLTSSLILSAALSAATVTVDVPAGDKVVEISSSVRRSGCSNSTRFLDVLKTEEGYVAGTSVAVKHEGDVWINVMPGPKPPMMTCMAMVKYTTSVKFRHSSSKDEQLDVVIPDSMERNLETNISDVQYAH